MFSIIRTILVRNEASIDAGQARRLRRAGYLDGERRPRHTRHWANR
jgi:hypothetical protein